MFANAVADKENTQGAENLIEESPVERPKPAFDVESSNLDKLSTMSPTKAAGKKLRQKKAKLINKMRG